MSPITTHVLDTARGKPAAGVSATLACADGKGGWTQIGSGETDADGRIKGLLPETHNLAKGDYRLTFVTGSYFRKLGTSGFYPEVAIHFQVEEPGQHYHVPLLLSPFGYATYRGS